MTETKCRKCGRTLRAAKSIADGYGRTCKGKVARALAAVELDEFSTDQVQRAADVIADAAIVPSSARGLYIVVASDGDDRYLTGSQQCTCKAAQYGRTCYHRAAAKIMDAVLAA